MKVIIVHGSNKNDKENIKKYNLSQQNERDWIGWLKEELQKIKINCFNPLMPKNWAPDYNEWKEEFEKIEVDGESILVGHSLGGTFLVRWLGETKQKIKKLILVAPAKVFHKNGDLLANFYNFEIDETIK